LGLERGWDLAKQHENEHDQDNQDRKHDEDIERSLRTHSNLLLIDTLNQRCMQRNQWAIHAQRDDCMTSISHGYGMRTTNDDMQHV